MCSAVQCAVCTQLVSRPLDDLCICIWISVMIMSQNPDNRETGYSNVLACNSPLDSLSNNTKWQYIKVKMSFFSPKAMRAVRLVQNCQAQICTSRSTIFNTKKCARLGEAAHILTGAITALIHVQKYHAHEVQEVRKYQAHEVLFKLVVVTVHRYKVAIHVRWGKQCVF